MKKFTAITVTTALLGSSLICAQATSSGKKGWVNFGSTSFAFSYPMSMGTKISSKKIPAVKLASPDEKPDDVAPEHWDVKFSNADAHLNVIPTFDNKVKDFHAAYPTVDDAAKDLHKLLQSHPVAANDIPFLPWGDCSTPIHSHVKYVKFKHGSGVRYLANYQIEPEEISNDGLVYSMQGLSDDGKYFVSLMVPVKTKSLPEKSSVATWSKDKYEKFSANFKQYATETKAKLDKISDDDFNSKLSLLDEMVGTIVVK